MQSDDLNQNIMGLEPLSSKWESFGWHVIEINGHDFNEISEGFQEARSQNKKPTILIAHTIKGKGVSFMENSPTWHGSLKLSEDDFLQSLNELGVSEEEIKGYLKSFSFSYLKQKK